MRTDVFEGYEAKGDEVIIQIPKKAIRDERKPVTIVTVENLGKIIHIGSPGTSRKMRLLKVKDKSGKESNAMAMGNLSESLVKGSEVAVIDNPSSNPSIKFSSYLIIKKM